VGSGVTIPPRKVGPRERKRGTFGKTRVQNRANTWGTDAPTLVLMVSAGGRHKMNWATIGDEGHLFRRLSAEIDLRNQTGLAGNEIEALSKRSAGERGGGIKRS